MIQPSIRLLLVEDNPLDAEMELRELKRAGLSITHQRVDTEDGFIDALRHFSPDVIVSDFSMPHFDGMSALAIARERAPDVPFIFVSGTIGEEYAIRAVKNGATDYVLKTNLIRLPPALERALAEARERRNQRRIQVELDLTRDRLTRIFNTLPDMLWSADSRAEHVLFASPAARQLFGHSADDFLKDPMLWLNLAHPEDRPQLEVSWKRLRQGEALDIDYRSVLPGGAVRWINQRAQPIRDTSGAIERIDGTARDITERMEQRLRIERLSRIRDLLGAVNSAIVRIRDRKALFEEFCRIAVSKAGFTVARILEVDADGRLRIAATTEPDERGFQKVVDDYNLNGAESGSLLALAMTKGETVIANDVATDKRAMRAAETTREGSFALAVIPLKVEDRLAGVVTLRAREAGFFDTDERRLLYEMVGNIAFALELLEKQERLSYVALYDALTGLPNRTFFRELLRRTIESAQRSQSSLSLVVVDLERFKSLNDTLGAPNADAVLKAVGQRLIKIAGDIGHVARLGGDVFAITFPGIGADEVARMLEESQFFRRPFDVAGREIRLTGKRGVAVYPDDGADADTLFRNAEAALKQAKESGEGYIFYAPEINARVAERVELENRLREAVEKGELHFHYQPKVDLATKRLVGVEALMRWNGPHGEAISPAKFVPVLEETGLILEAGRQGLVAASKLYRRWQAQGLEAPRIAVNVSAIQLRRPSFVADVRASLAGTQADGGGIDLEITESLLMSDVEASIEKLRALRDLGLNIALDDFGTGYSSLAYLSKLPIDTVKIDRAFVHGMTREARDLSIVSAILSLARALRLKVVAEGVEEEAEANVLRELGCGQAQGYFFGRPVSADRIESLLRSTALT